MLRKIIKKKIFKKLSDIDYGQINIKLPDGIEYTFTGKFPGVKADLALSDWRAFAKLINKGDVGLAEDYQDGYCDSSSIEKLLLFALQNEKLFNSVGHGGRVFKQMSKLLYLTKRNTISGSKKNIQAHYDLGNSFYKLWLDESMTYSSALFLSDSDDLKSGHYNKYKRFLNKISIDKANILEIGCGWGGFAELAAIEGHTVTGITLSNQQYEYAVDRTKNLDVNIKLEDYRYQQGKYDIIVSIEMVEAVGEKYWNTYFKKLAELIKDDGKIMLQVITIDDKFFKNYRKNADMIRSLIFPGGMLLCENAINNLVKRNNLHIIDKHRFGLDYAKTLEIWLSNFNSNYNQVKALGFNEKFIRLWQFYLSLCIAGFKHGRINVIQLEIIKSKGVN